MAVEKICAMCGGVFHVKPYRETAAKYCSRSCTASAASRDYSGARSVHYRDVSERFWAKVLKTDGCWEWTGSRKAFGYGNFNDGRRTVVAHRFAYELLVGPIPPGMFACHHCDNPWCVNPDHLFIGTAKDNVDDCVNKSRNNPPVGDRNASRKYPGFRAGERNGMAKLTAEQVDEIRALASAETQPAIAKRFGVSLVTVNRIVCGRRWTQKNDHAQHPRMESVDGPRT